MGLQIRESGKPQRLGSSRDSRFAHVKQLREFWPGDHRPVADIAQELVDHPALGVRQPPIVGRQRLINHANPSRPLSPEWWLRDAELFRFLIHGRPPNPTPLSPSTYNAFANRSTIRNAGCNSQPAPLGYRVR